MRPRHVFLIIVIASLCIAALIGIGAMLLGRFGQTSGRLIGTMMSIALFSLTSLGATFAMRRGLWMGVAIATYAISALGVPLYLFMCWFDGMVGYPAEERVYQAMGLMATWAVALPLIGLLALSWFDNWLRWVRGGVLCLPLALALTITLAIVTELRGDDEIWMRFIGVQSILTVLMTIVLPILHRLFGGRTETESTRRSLGITCPRCFLQQTVSVGHSRCAQCRLWFEIKVEEPRCPHCQYQLFNLTRPVCPDCGQALSPDELPGNVTPPADTAQPVASQVE